MDCASLDNENILTVFPAQPSLGTEENIHFFIGKKQNILFGFLIKNKYSVLNVLFHFPLRTELGKALWCDQMLQSLARLSLCLLFLSAVITFWHVLLKYLGLLCNLH